MSKCDVVKASDEDMRRLEPGMAPEEVAERWLAAGPAVVAVTMGAGGAFATCRAGAARHTDLRAIGVDILRDVLDSAVLNAALTVVRPGAHLPDRAARDAAATGIASAVVESAGPQP